PKMAFVGIFIVCLLAGGLVGALFGGLGPVLAVVLVFVTCAAILMIRSTEWGIIALVGVITLLPYATLPFKIVFTPTFLNLIMGALFGVWFLLIITGKETTFIGTPIGGAVFAFFAWAIVAFAFGLRYGALTPNVIRNFAEVLLAVFLFFAAVNLVKTTTTLKRISIFVLLGGGGTALLGILFYVLPETLTTAILSRLRVVGYPTDGILRYIEDDPDNFMRAISTSIDPNALGGLMIILTVIGVAHLFADKPLIRRRYLMVLVGAMVLTLFLTFSRGSLIGVVAAIGLMGVLRYRKLLAYMAAGGVLVLILPQTQFYVTRLVEGLLGQDLATQMRFGEYKDAMILISRYPILGAGFSGTPDIDIYVGVSSLYFLIAEQMGIVGVVLFLIANFAFFMFILRVWRTMEPGHILEGSLLGYTFAVFGAMVGGIFDHFFFNIQFTHLVSLYWLVMGLAAATALIYQRSMEPQT
ncbi:MAG: O-antigen ligase family protein, partial [Chloroflexota bacterium]